MTDHTFYSSEDEDDDLACVWRWWRWCAKNVRSACGHWNFEENWTLLSTTTKQQQAMKTGPPGYLYTHTHTHTRNHARTVAHSPTHKHSRYIHHSIYPVHTHTDADLSMRTHTLKTYLTYKSLHSRTHTPAYMHVYIYMQMLIT